MIVTKKLFCVISALLLVAFAVHADPMDLSADVKDAFKKAGMPLLKEKRQIKDFTLKTVDGRNLTLSQLKGKVVFLNFWATWCPPCRAEMPSMEILYQRYKDRGLEFIAVDIMESNSEVRGFIQDGVYTFPVVLDSGGSISGGYGIQSIPATFIIDRDSKIVFAAVGARNWNTPAVFDAFEKLLTYGQ